METRARRSPSACAAWPRRSATTAIWASRRSRCRATVRAASADPARRAARPGARRAQGCQRCKLCKSRTTIVFGSGNPARAAHGDRRGPRRGRGQAGHALRRPRRPAPHQDARRRSSFDRERDCYIANVVKCRPERNRNPEPDEVAACNPFLMAQIDDDPARGDPRPRQLRHPDPARHQGRHHQAPGPRVSVPLRRARPDVPSRLPAAQSRARVQAHGVGRSEAGASAEYDRLAAR